MTGVRGERGFTLLEVMIALGVLAVSLVVLLGLRNRDVQLQAYARDLTQATLLARSLLVEIEHTADGLALGYMEGDFGEEFAGFSWQRNVNTFMIERVREVQVAVLWGEAERIEVTRFVEAE